MTQANEMRADGSKPRFAIGLLRAAGIALGLGVLFAWFGVYGTMVFPLPERILYWTILMGIGIAASVVVNPLIVEKLLPTAPAAVQIAAISALISVPITIGLGVFEAASDGSVAALPWWGIQYLYVIALSAVMTALAWVVTKWREGQLASSQTAPVASGAISGFADRLPAKFRSGEIYAVSAEDHYLRVHTGAGETMILMRLADAIRELAALEGLQTHRSWWVAKQGLADIAKGDGKVTLKLKSGAEAPVSRTYLKSVKDAGWL